MSTPPAPRERKVRIACQRCRDRRIKCDGRAPSCSKCEKAGVQCIDVSTVSSVGTVPRGLLSDALSRVEWLENIVKTHLPDVDLTEGTPESLPRVAPAQPPQSASIAGSTSKRRADVAGLDSPGTPVEHGKRMARDLGLVSLNVSNSRTHYLGASSGQFFVNLLQDDRETHNQVAGEDESAESSEVEDGFGANGRGPPSRGNFAVLKKLQKVLPTQDECNRHVRLFFHHYHPEYPVLHQPTVYSLVAALYTSLHVPSADSLAPHGWPVDIAPFDYNGEAPDEDGRSMVPTSPTAAAAQLLFILATAAHLQNHKHRFGSDPRPYEDLAVQLMSRSLGDVSLESVQLIVLSILHGFISGKSGNPWVFLHLGMAYAVDLGLHRASQDSTRFSSEHKQMRRRVFFCLYTLDRFISSVQGRPLGFQDDTLELGLPTRIENGQSISKEDQALMDYSIARFQWAQLISEIKYHLYRFSSSSMAASIRKEMQSSLHLRLDEWVSDSLQQLETSSDKRAPALKTELKIKYEYAICLLYQPSISCRHPDPPALKRCFDSAIRRLNMYWSLHEHQALILSWPVTHGIFLAGTTLIFCIWTSQDVRSSMAVSQISKDLRLCTNLLTLGGAWWTPARRCCRSFQHLVDITTNAFLFPSSAEPAVSAATTTLPLTPSLDEPSGQEAELWDPNDIEEMLRSFMQNDYQFSDLFDNLQAVPMDASDDTWSFNLPST